MTKKDSADLKPVYARLFDADVKEIKRRAAKRGIPWQIELRLLVRQALRDMPDIALLDPTPSWDKK